MKLKKFGSTEQKIYELIAPVVNELGYLVWDVRYEKEGAAWYLRIFIDSETDTVSINDCETVSRELEMVLDARDFISNAYILEVSSPGLTRPLKKDRDYDRNIGKPVEVHTYRPIDGVKEFTGDLLHYNKDAVVLDIGPEDVEEITIPRDNIAVIKQYFVF